jgi:arylsulfatase A
MPTTAHRPNILFILADDLGCGDLGCLNGGLSQTPALDSLAAASTGLSQQYAASPVCNPSRAALLTGRYPHRTGSIDTLEWRGLERLALREVTLADVLRAAGYATGLVGKWHLGAFDPRYSPTARGFSEAVCFRGGMHDYYKWRIERNNQPAYADGRYLTDVWTEEAVQFLQRHRREPFFLHLAYNAPHTPLQVPEDDLRPFLHSGRHNRAVATLYGMIRRMDRGIGRVLETLDQLGLRENTIVIFTSDNGPQMGGQGEDSLSRFNCHLRGAKCSTYEGGVRVPLFIRWPAGLPTGHRIVDPMVHFCDWFPTLLSLAGVPLPTARQLDGVDVAPVLRGEPGKVQTTRCWQWNRYTPVPNCNAAIRDGEWKLVRPAIPAAMRVVDGQFLAKCMYEYDTFGPYGVHRAAEPIREVPPPPPPELYHLTTDPGEERNVAADHPAVVDRLQSQLFEWFLAVEAERRTIDDDWWPDRR